MAFVSFIGLGWFLLTCLPGIILILLYLYFSKTPVPPGSYTFEIRFLKAILFFWLYLLVYLLLRQFFVKGTLPTTTSIMIVGVIGTLFYLSVSIFLFLLRFLRNMIGR